jgi:hypothetical protein
MIGTRGRKCASSRAVSPRSVKQQIATAQAA